MAFAELGSSLRKARLEKGRSVTEMATDTGLPERYVVAMEEGNMDALPDPAYARLYCQSYARALSLDVEAVMQSWPRPKKVESVPPPSAPTLEINWSRLLLWMAVSSGVLLLGWFGMKSWTHAPALPEETQAETPVDSSFSGSAELPLDSTAMEPASLVAEAPDTTAQVAEPVHRMTLSVTAAEQSWVVIEADGDTVEARVLVKDQTLQAEAEQEFLLTATNSRGLKVLLDGQAVALDARADRPLIRHRITGKESP